MQKLNSDDLNYLAAISFLQIMLRQSPINADDYCVLETIFAAIFMPFFRHEKPCNLPTLPIRQSEQEGR